MAAHERKSPVNQRKMQWMPDEVVDQQRAAADACGLIGKAGQLCRLQMMREKAASHQIKTGITEGKVQSVGCHGPVAAPQVRVLAIEVGNMERNSPIREPRRGSAGDLPEAGGHVQHGEVFLSGERSNSL